MAVQQSWGSWNTDEEDGKTSSALKRRTHDSESDTDMLHPTYTNLCASRIHGLGALTHSRALRRALTLVNPQNAVVRPLRRNALLPAVLRGRALLAKEGRRRRSLRRDGRGRRRRQLRGLDALLF